MTEPRFDRIQQIFEEAVELTPEERAAFLDRVCAGDAELRRRIEELLATDQELEGFLEPPLGFGLPAERLASEAEHFLPEEEIGGFRLIRELGRGGRGVVYLAQAPDSEELVALKVLGVGLLPSAVAVARFRREVKAVARLAHPGIVRLRSSGDDSGRPFLVMEHVEGHTLADEIRLHRHARDGGELPPHLREAQAVLPTSGPARVAAIVDLVRQIGEALQHAHERQVLHRDVKPQNILLDPQGKPCLIDFGLAAVAEEQSLTRTGAVEGTPNYMSPEQVRAERERIDARTDVYSLGVVLYELLTLRRPFDAPTADQVMQNITRTMPPRIRRVAPGVPRELELICSTAIEKKRRDRYRDMAGLVADLTAFEQGRALRARWPSLVTRARRAIERRPLPYVAAGAALLALLLGAWAVRALDLRRLQDAVVVELHTQQGHPLEERDLRPLLEAVARLPRGAESLPAETAAQLASIRQQADVALTAFLIARLRAPEQNWLELSLAESPFAPDAAGQATDQFLDRAARAGISAERSEELLARGRQAQLQLVLDDASWDQIQAIRIAPDRPDTLGRQPWQPLTPDLEPGLFRLDAGRSHTVELQTASRRTQITVLPVQHQQMRVLHVGLERAAALDWVSVPRASVALQPFRGASFAGAEDRLTVPAFRAQDTPLSFRQLLPFLRAVDWPWRFAELDWSSELEEGLLDRPATLVTLDEAAACAAWYGVRLPNAVERELAIRGPSLPAAPPGVDPAAYLGAMQETPYWQGEDYSTAPGDEPASLRWMREILPTVDRAGPFDLSASGARLGLAGVFELTTTNFAALTGGPAGPDCLISGAPAGWDMDFTSLDSVEARWAAWFETHVPSRYQPDIGFRCVAPEALLP